MRHTITNFYFPKGMRYAAVLFCGVVGFMVVRGSWVWAVLLLILILFIFTARYVTIIDLGRKEFIDAFSFMGIMIISERRNFTNLDRIVVTKGNYSQKISTRSSDRQLDWSDYTGTLIYDESGRLDLLTREDRKELVEALKVYATALHVTIEDRTSSRSLI